MSEEVLFVLMLRGTLLAPLMARNTLKSNVTWASYPFLPPTGASGCLADVVGKQRWHEGNALGLDARRLQEISGFETVFALGAYPYEWQISRRHFRSHLGSIFNYEATVWSAGRNEGKKLAVIEETISDTLIFVVASHRREPLETLHQRIRGRLTPLAKKGSVQLSYGAHPEIIELSLRVSSGQEETLALMSVTEMGSLPRRRFFLGQTLVHHVPVRSRLKEGRMEWDILPCIWEEEMRFRVGVPIFCGIQDSRRMGISYDVWNRIRQPWV